MTGIYLSQQRGSRKDLCTLFYAEEVVIPLEGAMVFQIFPRVAILVANVACKGVPPAILNMNARLEMLHSWTKISKRAITRGSHTRARNLG